jgi:hypothetical protein
VPGLTPSSRWEVQAAEDGLSDETNPRFPEFLFSSGITLLLKKDLENFEKKYSKQSSNEQNITNAYKQAHIQNEKAILSKQNKFI